MRSSIKIESSVPLSAKKLLWSRQSRKYQLLANTFKTLGDYSRVRIVSALVEGEKCPSEIAERVDLSPSAVSHH